MTGFDSNMIQLMLADRSAGALRLLAMMNANAESRWQVAAHGDIIPRDALSNREKKKNAWSRVQASNFEHKI